MTLISCVVPTGGNHTMKMLLSIFRQNIRLITWGSDEIHCFVPFNLDSQTVSSNSAVQGRLDIVPNVTVSFNEYMESYRLHCFGSTSNETRNLPILYDVDARTG